MKIIPNSVTRSIGRHILTAKKNSPRTMFVAGVVGVGVSTVLACRATLKLNQHLDNMKRDIDDVKENSDKLLTSENEYRRELARTYFEGSYGLVKLYAPAIVIGGASIGLLTGSHVTLTRRNAALTAAYSAVQMSYEAYRDRVRAEYGEEKELDLYHAAHLEKVTIDGKVDHALIADPNKWSMYARFFDEASPNWQKNAEYNRIFVTAQQNYLNHRLHARGHVFLNEAYDALGLPRSSAGQVVGWVIGDTGDNYIDFGIYEAHNARFLEGWERSILLDFNVDGVIYNLIG